MNGWVVGRSMVATALIAVAFASVTTLDAGAATRGTGVITGRVVECAPLRVAAPGFPTPSATPSTVILVHNHVAYATKSIDFSTTAPWVGAFSFTVPAGRYEVISTYQGFVRWVVVRPSSANVIDFGTFTCPQ